jgi:hypothetical protein
LSSSSTSVDPTHAIRTRLLQRGRRFAFPIPDAAIAFVLLAATLPSFLSWDQLARLPYQLFVDRDDLFFILMVEAGFLLAQGTLVDIATRLEKRPPVWAIPIIVAGVFVLSNESRDVLRIAWERGSIVFVPLVISLLERGYLLWQMPRRSPLEKIAARALISNRIATGVGLFGVMTAVMLIGVAVPAVAAATADSWHVLVAGAIYYGVAACDDWRVRGRRFAERPTVLFGYDLLGMHNTARVL